MTPPESTTYTLTGRITLHGTERGASGLRVEAFDHDRARPPQRLSEAETDGEGRFELTFRQGDAGGRGEGLPEPFVRITTADGALVLQTPPASLEGPYPGDSRTEHDFGTFVVPGDAPAGPGEGYGPHGGIEGGGDGGETAGSPGASLGKSPQPKDPSQVK